MWTKLLVISIILLTFGCKPSNCSCQGDITDKDALATPLCEAVNRHASGNYILTTHHYMAFGDKLGIFFEISAPNVDTAWGYGYFTTDYERVVFVLQDLGTGITDEQFMKDGVPSKFWKHDE